MAYMNEKQVSDIAAAKLTSALRARTGGFKAHISGSATPSLRDVKAVGRINKYKSAAGINTYYLRAISIRMVKHGFLHNFGVDKLRAGGFRNREKPSRIRYYYRPHYFNMPAVPFINEAIAASGVVSFVSEEVAKLRSEEIVAHFSVIFEKL